MKKEKKSTNKKRRILSAALLVICLTAFIIWQNNDLTLSYYTYDTAKISSELNGYKIVQISDLHNKEFGKEQERLISKIEKEQPDIIAITGDIIDANHTDIDKALVFVEEAVKIAPVYYVTGNHEYMISSEDKEQLIDDMAQYGVTVLDNDTVKNKCRRRLFLSCRA